MNDFLHLVRYELKKIFTPKKTIITTLFVFLLITVMFFLELNSGINFENIQQNQINYTGEITSNIFVEANNRADEIRNDPNNYIDEKFVLEDTVIKEEFYSYEHPQFLTKLNDTRQNLAIDILKNTEISSKDERLILTEYSKKTENLDVLVNGDTISISFLEEFISQYFPLILAFVMSMFLAPIFAFEHTSKMDSIILTSRYGKNKLITAKILVTFLTTSIIYLLVVGSCFALSVARWGMFDTNSSFILLVDAYKYILSPFDFKMGEFFYLLVGLPYIACLNYALFIMCLSTKIKKSLNTSIVSIMFVFVPFMLYRGFSMPYNKITTLFKLNYADLIGVRNLFNEFYAITIGESVIDLTTLILPILIISSVIFVLITIRSFKNHQIR